MECSISVGFTELGRRSAREGERCLPVRRATVLTSDRSNAVKGAEKPLSTASKLYFPRCTRRRGNDPTGRERRRRRRSTRLFKNLSHAKQAKSNAKELRSRLVEVQRRSGLEVKTKK
ncbi:hypothetical protein KFK09_025363 [Dendrobium nobile]|uniref:Uncharacterized protein n=1 Tax=Dendrobium nobile TaxID=94219 RepID=A0A8T3AGB7_DENNO|nr:hypothetical protein KFK09_025363 [Dendrobium nobile]